MKESKQFKYSRLEDNEALQKEGLVDPIGDKNHEAVENLVHRYKNRVLFLSTEKCVVNCRFCFRKNLLHEEKSIDFKKIVSYLKKHPEVIEFIFSGGDPLTIKPELLDEYLKALHKTKIRFIRFHTRVPIHAPKLITVKLLDVLKKHQRHFKLITLALHCNEAQELDSKARTTIKKLQGFQLISQTVLLKGINDNPKTLSELFLALVEAGVRPYYLHHPDRVKGAMHFSVSIPKGRKIYGALRDLLPGWAIPHYVLDIPGGEGKVPLFNPEGHEFSGKLLSKNAKLVLTEKPQND